MGTTEVGNTLGGKSGKMGSIRMGVYTGMGRRQNRWIPIHMYGHYLSLLRPTLHRGPTISLLWAYHEPLVGLTSVSSGPTKGLVLRAFPEPLAEICYPS